MLYTQSPTIGRGSPLEIFSSILLRHRNGGDGRRRRRSRRGNITHEWRIEKKRNILSWTLSESPTYCFWKNINIITGSARWVFQGSAKRCTHGRKIVSCNMSFAAPHLFSRKRRQANGNSDDGRIGLLNERGWKSKMVSNSSVSCDGRDGFDMAGNIIIGPNWSLRLLFHQRLSGHDFRLDNDWSIRKIKPRIRAGN